MFAGKIKLITLCISLVLSSCGTEKPTLSNTNKAQCVLGLMDQSTAHPFALQSIQSHSNDPKNWVALVQLECLQTQSKQALRMPPGIFNDTYEGQRVLELTYEMNSTQVEDLLKQDPCILGVEEKISFTSSGTLYTNAWNDPMALHQDHLYNLGLDQIDDEKREMNLSVPVTVAVIDTGVDIYHEDLKHSLWVNQIEKNGQSAKDSDSNGYVDDVYGYNFADRIPNPSPVLWSPSMGHGTHVAGLTGATNNNGIGVRGVSSAIRIMSLNIFGQKDSTNAALIDEAVRYAVDNGAQVINLSLGGTGYAATVESTLNYALSKGVVVVTAAGNDNRALSSNTQSNAFYTPASMAYKYPGVLSVASSDSRNFRKSFFSNYSQQLVKITAPGSENSFLGRGLLSTLPDNQYDRFEGTSMAAPLVSGVAAMAIAMLKQRGQNYTPAQIENLLLAFADPRAELGPYVTHGRHLNAQKLFDYLKNNHDIINLPENELQDSTIVGSIPQEAC